MHDRQEIARDRSRLSIEGKDQDVYDDPPRGLTAASNLMSVLSSATPPVPHNARVITRIGLGAGKAGSAFEHKPLASSPAAATDELSHAGRKNRRALRALRNTSLRAAAGFK